MKLKSLIIVLNSKVGTRGGLRPPNFSSLLLTALVSPATIHGSSKLDTMFSNSLQSRLLSFGLFLPYTPVMIHLLSEPFSDTEMEGTSVNPPIPRVAGSEASMNQGPHRSEGGPSTAGSFPSLSSIEKLPPLGSNERELSPEVDQPEAGPVLPANPVADHEAAQEALPQAPAPAEVPHPVPNQEEVAALRRELHVLIKERIREESERGWGRLSTQFPELREIHSEAAHDIMSRLELSEETDTESLREWADKIRDDPNLLNPLIRDYLIKRR